MILRRTMIRRTIRHVKGLGARGKDELVDFAHDIPAVAEVEGLHPSGD